jgi:ketosteroid isomerase-like protein
MSVSAEESLSMGNLADDIAVRVAKDYFARLDAGDAQLVELFTADAHIYFPKFGTGRGHSALLEVLTGLGGVIQSVQHHADSFVYTRAGNRLAVEGTTRGVLKSGVRWAAGETAAGRFCNVFEFQGDLICRMHVYLDPDYAGDDKGRFLWGIQGRTW